MTKKLTKQDKELIKLAENEILEWKNFIKLVKQNPVKLPKNWGKMKDEMCTGSKVKTNVQSKNSKTLESFTKYCQENPNQRFFQSLTNWFGVGYIGYSNDRIEWTDTFYLEEGKDYKLK